MIVTTDTRGGRGARSAAAVLLVALLGAASGPAHALFGDDEARKQIQELKAQNAALETRIKQLEEQINSQGLVNLYTQIETLKLDMARLRGQIEELANANDQTGKRQRDLYVDLDNRLRRLEQPVPTAAAPGGLAPGGPEAVGVPGAAVASAAAGAPAASAGPAPGVLDPGGEQRAYESAFNLFRIGNYPAAIAAFTNFSKTYPQSPLAPSALYWVGNSYYAMSDFKNAITAQQKMIKAYPEAQKVPDAMLNIASSQQELGDVAGAKKTLDELIKKYPLSDAAEKAKRRQASLR
ncbi:MAG TPA: tol-pal system protein YbgF [Pelomicrobium sp.]|nr:tol-pal system protein YbgF [Pelomicrobium sp.]